MILAVTTHSGLFLLNTADEEPILAELSFGYYYGLAVYDDYIIAARRIDPWSSKVSPTCLELWNRDGVCIGMLNEIDGNDLIDVHEMDASPYGLWICDLGNHSIKVFDNDTHELKRTLTFGSDSLPGGALPNSIAIDGNDIWILFHNRTEAPSFFQHFCLLPNDDLAFIRRIFLPSYGAHNVITRGDKLYYNCSDDGAVHGMHINEYESEDWDKKGKVPIQIANLGDHLHTKGIAISEDENLMIIGASEKGDLAHRFRSESHLVFLNLDDFAFRYSIQLRRTDGSNVGNINEIRLLD